MSTSNWIVTGVIIYLALIACVGSLASDKRRSSMAEYYVAGRSLGVSETFWTVFGTYFSASIVISIPGFFFTHGIGTWALFAFGTLLYPLVALIVGTQLARVADRSSPAALASPIELITGPYNSRGVTALACVTTIVFVTPYFALQIAGIGKVTSAVTDGALSYWSGALLALTSMLIYSYLGGLRVDVWTDVIQGALTLAVVSIVAGVFVGREWSWNIAALINDVQSTGNEALLSLPGPREYLTRPMLISVCLFYILVPITQPHLAVRLYVSRSRATMLRAMALFPIASLVVFVAVALIGLGAAARLTMIEGDAVVPTLVHERLPWWCGPLLAIGVLAAAMSTTDSLMLALSGIFVRNIYVPFFRSDAGENEQLRVGRAFMVVLLAAAFAIALNPPDLIAKLAVFNAAGTATLAPTYLGAIMFGVTDPRAAAASIAAGLVTLTVNAGYMPAEWRAGFDPGVPALAVATFVYCVMATAARRRSG